MSKDCLRNDCSEVVCNRRPAASKQVDLGKSEKMGVRKAISDDRKKVLVKCILKCMNFDNNSALQQLLVHRSSV